MALAHFLSLLTLLVTVLGQNLDLELEAPHEKFNEIWFENARNLVRRDFRRLSVAKFEIITNETKVLEEKIMAKFAEILQMPLDGLNFTMVEKIFQERVLSGDLNSADVSKIYV